MNTLDLALSLLMGPTKPNTAATAVKMLSAFVPPKLFPASYLPSPVQSRPKVPYIQIPNARNSQVLNTIPYTNENDFNTALKRYNMSRQELQRWNPNKDLSTLKQGETFYAPHNPFGEI